MKITELKKTMALLDECDQWDNCGVSFYRAEMPQWLKDDIKRSIAIRRQNLIEKLQKIGVDVEA